MGGAGGVLHVHVHVHVHVQVEVNGKKSTLHRNYKELLWLHRNLARKVELGGNIVCTLLMSTAHTRTHTKKTHTHMHTFTHTS